MTQQAVEGFRAERAEILALAQSLSDEEWMRPSACPGWTIRDVFGHMACTLHGVIDPAFLPDSTKGTEAGMEPQVADRRRWPIAQVVEEYETYSEQAAKVFTSVQDAPLSETMLPMGELGTHPMSILPSVFLFDGYTHLRADILAPSGSIERPQPERDAQRLRPTVEWMLAGLPWMCADALVGVVDRPLELTLDGPGGGTWTIAPGSDEGRVSVVEAPCPDAAARVRGTDHDFVIWGTTRAPWTDFVKVEGDADYAGRVLDAINII
jgi:uncharacterized protein (TIGR03083 family)